MLYIFKFIFVLLIARLASASFKGWSENESQGTLTTHKNLGIFKFDYTIKSYEWEPEKDGHCVALYNDDTYVKSFCNTRNDKSPSSGFNKIFIWCSHDFCRDQKDQ